MKNLPKYNKFVLKTRPLPQGFTIIELMMTIVIAAVIITPLSIIILQAIGNTFLPEHYQIATSLLEGELERVTNLKFGSVLNESPANFTGNFSQYSYQVSFDYVNPDDLNTPVTPTVTNYKRVTITILRSGFPNVAAVTVVTNS